MQPRLDDKVAIITGAGSGIGRGTAQLFASEGASVVVSDVNREWGEETVRLIRDAGGAAAFFKADVGSEEDVAQLVRFANDTYSGLHIAVNNAGIEPDFVFFHELSLAQWDKNLRVNLTGVFLCMKHELKHMREHGGGSIVNISSIAAVKSVPKTHVYAAAKRGVLALTSCAAIESGPNRVRVNAICPGGIMTRMMEDVEKTNPEIWTSFKATIPLGVVGQPVNIAEAALWLASDAAAYVTGQHFSVDGGITS